MTRCHVKGCGGSATARRHSQTTRHVTAVRALAQRFDGNGPATAKVVSFRDPYGRTRNWDEEAREYAAARHAEYADELHEMIASGPLPERPMTEYPDGMSLISLREAADRLGLSPHTVYSAIRRGRMTGHKYGRDWLVEESEVAWYEMRSRGRVGWPKGRSRKKSA